MSIHRNYYLCFLESDNLICAIKSYIEMQIYSHGKKVYGVEKKEIFHRQTRLIPKGYYSCPYTNSRKVGLEATLDDSEDIRKKTKFDE